MENYGMSESGICSEVKYWIVARAELTFSSVPCDVMLSVEYQTAPSGKWHPALYEEEVVEQLLNTQFHDFVKKVKTTDCQAELRRLLTSGPPIWLSDKHALPIPEGDSHIVQVWYASNGQEKSAKLDGAVDGDERQALWDELNEFIIVEGRETDDEDKEENNGEET